MVPGTSSLGTVLSPPSVLVAPGASSTTTALRAMRQPRMSALCHLHRRKRQESAGRVFNAILSQCCNHHGSCNRDRHLSPENEVGRRANVVDTGQARPRQSSSMRPSMRPSMPSSSGPRRTPRRDSGPTPKPRAPSSCSTSRSKASGLMAFTGCSSSWQREGHPTDRPIPAHWSAPTLRGSNRDRDGNRESRR